MYFFTVEVKVIHKFEFETGDEVDAETEVLQKLNDIGIAKLGGKPTDMRVTCGDPEYLIDSDWFPITGFGE